MTLMTMTVKIDDDGIDDDDVDDVDVDGKVIVVIIQWARKHPG